MKISHNDCPLTAESDLQQITTADLHRYFSTTRTDTAQHFLLHCRIGAELKRRIPEFALPNYGFYKYMLAVAEGTLLPDIPFLLAGYPRTIRGLAQLSLTEQRKVLNAGYIPVLRNKAGTPEAVAVNVALDRLTQNDIVRAISPISKKLIPPSQQEIPGRAKANDRLNMPVTTMLSQSQYKTLCEVAAKAHITEAAVMLLCFNGFIHNLVTDK